MRRITVGPVVSVTDFMHMPDDGFALDVAAHGVTANFHDLSVVDGRPCELTGLLMSIVVDAGLSSELILAVFHELMAGSHAIIDLGTEPDLGYPIRWSGGQLDGSRTFCARDFSRHVIAAIESAIHAPIAA